MFEFEIITTGKALGASVIGLDVKYMNSPQVILKLRQAFLDYKVLVFKHQNLSDDDIARFATYFGAIFVPFSKCFQLNPNLQDFPVVMTIANGVPEYEQNSYLSNCEILPHSDHQWLRCPSSGSMLYAIEVPLQGGETRWVNLVQAYEELDELIRKTISDLRVISYDPSFEKPESVIPGYRISSQADEIEFSHPLIRTHPETGKKFVYLNCSYDVQVVNMNPKEGAELIEYLRQHINQSHFCYKHEWSVGDLVYYDNQCTLHARSSFAKNSRRVLKRISLAGSCPF